MKILVICLMIAPIFLSGCATSQSISQQDTVDIRVIFRTDYAGAKLVTKNKSSCTTPCALIYRNAHPGNDVMVDDVLSYQWESGATLNTRLVIHKSDFVKFGGDISYTVKRPSNHPNVALDQDKHNQVLAQQQRLAQEKAAQQRVEEQAEIDQSTANVQSEGSAFLELLGVLAGAYGQAEAERRAATPHPTNCAVSPPLYKGGSVHVTCY